MRCPWHPSKAEVLQTAGSAKIGPRTSSPRSSPTTCTRSPVCQDVSRQVLLNISEQRVMTDVARQCPNHPPSPTPTPIPIPRWYPTPSTTAHSAAAGPQSRRRESWMRPMPARTVVEGVRFFVYEAGGVRRRNVLFRGGARLWSDV